MKKYLLKIIKFISSVFSLYLCSLKKNHNDDFTEENIKNKIEKIKENVTEIKKELESDISFLEDQYLESGIIKIETISKEESKDWREIEIDIDGKFSLTKNILITVNYFLGKSDISEDTREKNYEIGKRPQIKIENINTDGSTHLHEVTSNHFYYGLIGGRTESIDARANNKKRKTSSIGGANLGSGGRTKSIRFPANELEGLDQSLFLNELLKKGLSIEENTLSKYEESVASISESLEGRIDRSGQKCPLWKYKDYCPPIEISAISGGKQFFYYNSDRFLIKTSGNESLLKLKINMSNCLYINKCIIVIETCSKYFGLK